MTKSTNFGRPSSAEDEHPRDMHFSQIAFKKRILAEIQDEVSS